MKLILKEDQANLGQSGDIVDVKPGYARNFLLPQGLALPADEKNVRRLEHARREVERHRLKVLATGQALKERLLKERVVIRRRAGDDGRLFGSVTAHDISQALAAKGVKVDRRTIQLPEHIKALGDHDIVIKIKAVGEASLKVSVEPQD